MKILLFIQSEESGYAANLEMATNEYKPSNRVVAEDELTRVETQIASRLMKLLPFFIWMKARQSKRWFILLMKNRLWLCLLEMINE